MTLNSMTGFARVVGACGAWRWALEIKTVNAKGLDMRVRLSSPFDRIESEVRNRIGKALVRGTCFLTLSVERDGTAQAVRVDEGALEKAAAAARAVAVKLGLAPPTLDGLLGLRGVVEVIETEDDDDAIATASAGVLKSLDEALAALCATREGEGHDLARVLGERLNAIAALTAAADANPARKPEAVKARLAEQVALLLDEGRGFDQNRLHQEAILLAAKADIREELDRLSAHIAAARGLLAEGRAVGRRLDFLAQELGREANTLCAKANDVSLTAQGLELKAQIEQFREQAQNIE